MTAKRGLQRVGYCSWRLVGPVRNVIIRREYAKREFQVYDERFPMVFHVKHQRLYDAISYAEWWVGAT